jgi:hypothetical protein
VGGQYGSWGSTPDALIASRERTTPTAVQVEPAVHDLELTIRAVRDPLLASRQQHRRAAVSQRTQCETEIFTRSCIDCVEQCVDQQQPRSQHQGERERYSPPSRQRETIDSARAHCTQA